jgi:hypothetical protein
MICQDITPVLHLPRSPRCQKDSDEHSVTRLNWADYAGYAEYAKHAQQHALHAEHALVLLQGAAPWGRQTMQE